MSLPPNNIVCILSSIFYFAGFLCKKNNSLRISSQKPSNMVSWYSKWKHHGKLWMIHMMQCFTNTDKVRQRKYPGVFCLVPKLGNYYPSCPFPTTGTLRWTARVKSSCYLVFSLHGSFPGSATNPKHTVEVTGSWFLLGTKITMNQKGALWRKLNTDCQGNFVFHIMGEACLILSMGG